MFTSRQRHWTVTCFVMGTLDVGKKRDWSDLCTAWDSNTQDWISHNYGFMLHFQDCMYTAFSSTLLFLFLLHFLLSFNFS